MATRVYHTDWMRSFDVPFTEHKHVELGRQTIEHRDEGREPGDALHAFEFEGRLKDKGDHPGLFLNCNDDRSRWFLNVYDKRHRDEIG